MENLIQELTQEDLEQVAGGLTTNSGTTTTVPAAESSDPMPTRGI